MNRRFALAPMSRLIRGLTCLFVPLPAVFVAGSTIGGASNVAEVLFSIGGGLALLWLAVWTFFRPSGFTVGDDGLTIEFPGRRLRVPKAELATAALLTLAEIYPRYGVAARVGVGGLWGSFGWLWSQERGWVDLYVTRTDRCVLIGRKNGKDLLINPDDPETFVAAIQEVVGGGDARRTPKARNV